MHLWHDAIMEVSVATMVSPHVCPARVLETPLEMPLPVCMFPTVKYCNRRHTAFTLRETHFALLMREERWPEAGLQLPPSKEPGQGLADQHSTDPILYLHRNARNSRLKQYASTAHPR